MEANCEIKIEVLRTVINRILDFIDKDLSITSVDLMHDLYWSVGDKARYFMAKQPAELECGSLKDDIHFVLSAYNNREQSIPVTLIHIAPLLEALASAVPSHVSPKPN